MSAAKWWYTLLQLVIFFVCAVPEHQLVLYVPEGNYPSFKVKLVLTSRFFFSLVILEVFFARDADLELVGDLIVSFIASNSGQIHLSVMIIIIILHLISYISTDSLDVFGQMIVFM